MAGKYSIETVFKAKDRFSKVTIKMSKGVDKFTRRTLRSLRSINRASDRTLGAMKKVGVGVAALAVPVAIAGASIVKTGATFEQAITNVGAVGLKTRDQIADLETKALELGESTKFTATEAAQGMEIMAKSGFKSQAILAGVGGVLDAAAASGLDMAEVAGHVGGVLKGMSMEAGKAGDVADVLALASARTNTTIATLGESMANIGGTASDLGIPLADTVSAIALLQDSGLGASVAGSSLNRMLIALATPTSALTRKFKKMGVEFQSSLPGKEGDMLPFQQVIANIAKAADSAKGNMQKVKLMKEMVGLFGQKAASKLIGHSRSGALGALTEELRVAEALEAAEGPARKMAEIRMDTTVGDWLKLDAAVDGVKNKLFGLEGSNIRDFLQRMRDRVAEYGPKIVAGVDKFFGKVRENMPLIKEWAGRIARVTVVLGALMLAAKAAAVVMAVVGAINPFTLALVALVAIVAYWPEITAFFGRVADDFEFLGAHIAQGFSDIWSSVVGKWTQLTAFFDSLWLGITSRFDAAWSAVASVAESVYADFVGAWEGLTSFFDSLWSGIADRFTTIVGPVIKTVGSVVKVVGGVFGGDPPAIGGGNSGGGSPEALSSQVLSPQERISRSISETYERQTVDVNINDPKQRATVTRRKRGGSGSGFGSFGGMTSTGAF